MSPFSNIYLGHSVSASNDHCDFNRLVGVFILCTAIYLVKHKVHTHAVRRLIK